MHRYCFSTLLFLTVAILANPLTATAESLASKNREGNQLYTEGRYEEAEKAYLDAQVNSPGKPEILYNLGNSLIKQGKMPQGIQALSQSSEKGNERIKSNSLYNTGNALYTTGDFKGSVETFIEALKLNPEDRDAKHNLELALQKLKQQEQDQQGKNQDSKKSDDKNNQQQPESEGGQPQPKENDKENTGAQNNQKNPGQRQPDPQPQREGSISKEQAEQILDAVRNQELEQQHQLMEARPRTKTNKRDW